MMERLAAWGVGIIALLLFAGTTLFSLTHQYPLPFSDGMAAMGRVVVMLEGRMEPLRFLLSKHAEHFHAGIYALLYADMRWFGGQEHLPLWLSFASHSAVFVLLTLTIWKVPGLPPVPRWALILLAAGLIASPANVEVWLFPFQAVLSTFRLVLLLALALALFAYGLSARSNLAAVAGYLLAATCLFLHGGGIMAPVLFMFVALLQRRFFWLLPPLLLLGLYVAVSHWADPSARAVMRLVTTLQTLPAKEIASILFRGICIFLGMGIQLLPGGVALLMGLFGFLCACAILVMSLHEALVLREAPPPSVTLLLALLAFAMISAVLAALLIVKRSLVFPDSFNTIYSTRYLTISQLFWISLLPVLCYCGRHRALIHGRRLGMAVLILIVAAVIGHYLIGLQRAYGTYAHFLPGMQQAQREIQEGRVSEETLRFLIQPAPNGAPVVKAVLSYMQKHQKGIFAP